MAGPTVTLTFAGDADRLERTVENVGNSTRAMGDEVESASRQVRASGEALDSFSEKADTTDTRAMGFRDTITGLTDTFVGLTDSSLSLGDRLLTLGYGIGDLASGFVNLLIPALGNLRTAMTFISSHPLLIFFGLLVAALVALWASSEDFRNIVIAAFNAVAGFITSVFGGAISWIVDRWNGVVDWFANLPSRIAGALGSLGGLIQGAFRGALNVAIDALNWGIDRLNDLIYGLNVINPFTDIPSIPHIRRLHTGGVVPGMPGEEVLAILQGGETVSSNGSGSAVTVAFTGDTNSAFATAFMNLVRTGQIQLGAGL